MAWDPRVADELRGLREDQERRSYEAYLRRNPHEEERITDENYRRRVRFIKNAQAFNALVAEVQKCQNEIASLNSKISNTSHHGFYTCSTGAFILGLFSAKTAADPFIAWMHRMIAVGITIGTAILGFGVGGTTNGTSLSIICFIVSPIIYFAVGLASIRLPLHEVNSMHKEIAKLRDKATSVKSRIDLLNAERITKYQACCVGSSFQALTTVRIEHENLSEFFMQKYG